ncbi:MAG: 16S rRNA (uracil(1498)-N(3))-methyltransferase [Alphaproteobacteria bacterium]|nr:16S rRNA (uracil(1498)-N(3))-methyltransferase [Alphaproteobacteria bacterium]MDE2112640.1 16S rRNA (uracil(1498)-N(3))-methyltransferase [Alphaproteobacteria bacterium]MDE2493749.1 16S rRNA (uracil(1498)-N(3))-methyltransferase [Alphaproteobacteria bacterium]
MGEDLKEPGGKVRLYVKAALGEGARVAPDDGQAHYLLHVMRARAGDRVSLFNGRDGEWLARIAETAKRGCTLECECRTAPQTEVPDLWLVFAPIKKTPADYLTQKATELGVRALQPVVTRRTIVQRVNLERMHANAVEAAEQSERLSVPEVREPQSFDKLLAAWPSERRILFCDEAGEAPPIAEALAAAPSGPWAIFTGPEGGFDPVERTALRAQPVVTAVSLGKRILRADTAALSALSIWQAIKGDWL